MSQYAPRAQEVVTLLFRPKDAGVDDFERFASENGGDRGDEVVMGEVTVERVGCAVGLDKVEVAGRGGGDDG